MEYEIKGIQELRRAFEKNPQQVIKEARVFLMRGVAVYKGIILNNPWRVGKAGGGVPVSHLDEKRPKKGKAGRSKGGNLRDTHVTTIKTFEASIAPNTNKAPYAIYVHEGTYKMSKRPWLDYAKQTGDKDIQKLQETFLTNVVAQLAK